MVINAHYERWNLQYCLQSCVFASRQCAHYTQGVHCVPRVLMAKRALYHAILYTKVHEITRMHSVHVSSIVLTHMAHVHFLRSLDHICALCTVFIFQHTTASKVHQKYTIFEKVCTYKWVGRRLGDQTKETRQKTHKTNNHCTAGMSNAIKSYCLFRFTKICITFLEVGNFQQMV
jgi:hypothetical protein